MKEIKPFDKKVWLSSPTMHGEELEYVKEAIESNWVSTAGENINKLEEMVAKYVGVKYAVALACRNICNTFGSKACCTKGI